MVWTFLLGYFSQINILGFILYFVVLYIFLIFTVKLFLLVVFSRKGFHINLMFFFFSHFIIVPLISTSVLKGVLFS